jgi:hypothetical protein
MKKFYLFLMLAFAITGFSQNGISYQALIINPNEQQIPGVNESGAPLSNKLICLRFSIIDQNMQSEYIETHKITTDAFGIVNLVIGSGQQIGGYASSFSNIVWDGSTKNLKVDLDVNAICTYFIEISNKPFTTIPFAYYAANSNVQNATTTNLGIVQLAGDLSGTATAPTVPGLATKEPTITAGTVSQYWRGDKTWQTLNKSAVGLANVDNTSDLNKPISTATQTALNAKEDLANKSTSIATDAASTTKYPSVKVIKDYVDAQVSAATIPDATTTIKGKLKLAGDLSGTADIPTVPGLATKENISNKSTSSTLGTSDILYPTQNAVKTYVDSQVFASTPDATTTIKGKLKLAGDLSGTAEAPTVPGLTTKEPTITAGTVSQYWRGDKTWQTLDKAVVGLNNVDNTSDLNKPISTATQTALNTKEDLVNKTTSIATDANSNIKYPTVKALVDYVTYSDVKVLNANYVAAETDYAFVCDASASSFSVTLPSAYPGNKGKVFVISKIDDTNNSISLIPSFKLTNASFVSSFNYANTIRVQSDGVNWIIIK